MKTIPALFLLAILTLSACAAPGNSSASLAGTAWNVTAINGNPIVAGSTPSLAFDEEQASGNGSCNSFSGQYSASGDSLSFGPLISTLMACLDNGISDQEAAYFAALAAAVKYQAQDNALHIFDKDGNEVITLEKQMP